MLITGLHVVHYLRRTQEALLEDFEQTPDRVRRLNKVSQANAFFDYVVSRVQTHGPDVDFRELD